MKLTFILVSLMLCQLQASTQLWKTSADPKSSNINSLDKTPSSDENTRKLPAQDKKSIYFDIQTDKDNIHYTNAKFGSQ